MRVAAVRMFDRSRSHRVSGPDGRRTFGRHSALKVLWDGASMAAAHVRSSLPLLTRKVEAAGEQP